MGSSQRLCHGARPLPQRASKTYNGMRQLRSRSLKVQLCLTRSFCPRYHRRKMRASLSTRIIVTLPGSESKGKRNK